MLKVDLTTTHSSWVTPILDSHSDSKNRENMLNYIEKKNFSGLVVLLHSIFSQQEHDVKMTLYGRCYDVKTLKRRSYNVVLGWVIKVSYILYLFLISYSGLYFIKNMSLELG